MNKVTLTVGLLMGLWMTHDTNAQEYLRLKQDDVVYDVDVVVFARRLAQPSAETFNNAPLLTDPERRFLTPWDPDWPLLNFPVPEPPENAAKTEDEWQVPIEEKPKEVDALVWVAFASNPNHPVLQRLSVNPNLKPLLHQQWRQPATAFLQPEYVAVTTLPQSAADATEESNFGNNGDFNEGHTDEPLTNPSVDHTFGSLNDFFATPQPKPDYSVDGQVAFSKQRFTHLHVKMNLFRINETGEPIVHAISQQRQVELGEWQYFDHQQFGILAKVTAVSLKPPQVEENNEVDQ